MIVEYVDSKGIISSSYNELMEYTIVAKKVVTENLKRHFIKRSHGRLLDVKKLSSRELKQSIASFIEVPEQVYEKYIDYILCKTKTPLNSIERMID